MKINKIGLSLCLGISFLWDLGFAQSVTITSAPVGNERTLYFSEFLSNDYIYLDIDRPEKEPLNFKIETNNQGKAEFVLHGTHVQVAGPYEFEILEKGASVDYITRTSVVSPQPFSSTKSTWAVPAKYSEVGHSVSFLFEPRDLFGNLITAEDIHITSSRRSDEIHYSSTPYGISGSIIGNQEGTAVLIASSRGKTVQVRPEIYFGGAEFQNSEVGTGYQNLGDFLKNQFIDDEDSTVAYFDIVGVPAKVSTNEPFPSFSITARDINAEVVTDFTGNVRFASSDVLAVLPADTSFASSDQGQLTFSETVSLGTLGAQTFSIVSEEDFRIAGEIKVMVEGDDRDYYGNIPTAEELANSFEDETNGSTEGAGNSGTGSSQFSGSGSSSAGGTNFSGTGTGSSSNTGSETGTSSGEVNPWDFMGSDSGSRTGSGTDSNSGSLGSDSIILTSPQNQDVYSENRINVTGVAIGVSDLQVLDQGQVIVPFVLVDNLGNFSARTPTLMNGTHVISVQSTDTRYESEAVVVKIAGGDKGKFSIIAPGGTVEPGEEFKLGIDLSEPQVLQQITCTLDGEDISLSPVFGGGEGARTTIKAPDACGSYPLGCLVVDIYDVTLSSNNEAFVQVCNPSSFFETPDNPIKGPGVIDPPSDKNPSTVTPPLISLPPSVSFPIPDFGENEDVITNPELVGPTNPVIVEPDSTNPTKPTVGPVIIDDKTNNYPIQIVSAQEETYRITLDWSQNSINTGKYPDTENWTNYIVRYGISSSLNPDTPNLTSTNKIPDLRERWYIKDLAPNTEHDFQIWVELFNGDSYPVAPVIKATTKSLGYTGATYKQYNAETPSKPSLEVQQSGDEYFLRWGGAQSSAGISNYLIRYGADANSLIHLAQTGSGQTSEYKLSQPELSGQELYFQIFGVNGEGTQGVGSNIVRATKGESFYSSALPLQNTKTGMPFWILLLALVGVGGSFILFVRRN